MSSNAITTTAPTKGRYAVWLIAAANVLLALGLTIGHSIKAGRLVNWMDYLSFGGQQPFQSRVLPFLVANLVDQSLPLSGPGLGLLFLLLDFVGAVVCFTFVWKAWTRLSGGDPDRSRSLMTLLFLFWWQLFATFVLSEVHNYYYPYDMMSLGFMAVAIWMIVSDGPLLGLIAVSVLAMMNRETAILIPFFYLAFNWPASPTVWRRFACLLVACLAVKVAISIALHVRGDVASLYLSTGQLRLHYNFMFLWSWRDARFLHTWNAFFAFGFAWVLLFMGKPADPRLRRMLLCLIPFTMGMAVVGNLSEIRVFAEFIPLMALLLVGKMSGGRV